MAKRKGFSPYVLLLIPDPTETSVVGGGTGQSTTDPFMCSYDEWLNLFASDYDGDGKVDGKDYEMWFFATFEDAADYWDLYSGTIPASPEPIIVPDPSMIPEETEEIIPMPTVSPEL